MISKNYISNSVFQLFYCFFSSYAIKYELKKIFQPLFCLSQK